MRAHAAALGLFLAATQSCGSSDNATARRLDAAAADGGIRKDGGRDVPSSPVDTSGAARDGGAGPDTALDGGMGPDAPWVGPDAPSTCHVDITPITPATLVNLTAGPTASLRVQGTVN
jgi:hypothetical protein